MALPDPARISISDTANWLYESVVHDDMDEYNADTLIASDQHEEVHRSKSCLSLHKRTPHIQV